MTTSAPARLRQAARDAHGDAGIGFHPCLRTGRGAVVDGQPVAGIAEVTCHRRAHDAKAEKRDVKRFGHGGLFSRFVADCQPVSGHMPARMQGCVKGCGSEAA
jgi:hypothetical protein